MNKLKQIRLEKNMTQHEFSEFIGVPFRSIQNWETGQRKCPEYVEKLLIDKLTQINYKTVLNEVLAMLPDTETEIKQYIQNILEKNI